MLEEIIKELTTAKNGEHITSGDVLAWTKRVEVQRAQAAVLITITKSRQFDKTKVSRIVRESKTKDTDAAEQILCQDAPAKTMPSLW